MLQEALDSAAMLQITVPVEVDLADVHHLGAICTESLEILVHQYREGCAVIQQLHSGTLQIYLGILFFFQVTHLADFRFLIEFRYNL